jgi:hypothetical protein
VPLAAAGVLMMISMIVVVASLKVSFVVSIVVVSIVKLVRTEGFDKRQIDRVIKLIRQNAIMRVGGS